MTDEAELNELRERIGRLRISEQLHLFELLLGDYRRKCDEARVTVRAELDALRAQESSREGPKRAAG
ncbi:hypothetical protein R5W24_000034 [Gemmata sp. JC717]|uniref:hypothetical protein n=1 Tax=Gemmata algarum TaxID=2975278 RepID=UPI0021BB5C30|nr:hypothetical protein [Gemmata algarum]MDY3550965.1 hypothetical protein [Gemmata algarum]